MAAARAAARRFRMAGRQAGGSHWPPCHQAAAAWAQRHRANTWRRVRCSCPQFHFPQRSLLCVAPLPFVLPLPTALLMPRRRLVPVEGRRPLTADRCKASIRNGGMVAVVCCGLEGAARARSGPTGWHHSDSAERSCAVKYLLSGSAALHACLTPIPPTSTPRCQKTGGHEGSTSTARFAAQVPHVWLLHARVQRRQFEAPLCLHLQSFKLVSSPSGWPASHTYVHVQAHVCTACNFSHSYCLVKYFFLRNAQT